MTHVDFAMITLLNGIGAGALLSLAMWLFLKLFPRLNPTTRFTVLWITLFAVVALLIGPFTQKQSAQDAQPDPSAAVQMNTSGTITPTVAKIEEPKFNIHTSDTGSRADSVSSVVTITEPASAPATRLMKASTAALQTGWSSIPHIERPLIHVHSKAIVRAAETLWAFLSFILMMRLGLGYRKLCGLKANAALAPARWQTRLKDLSRMNGVHRKIRLLVSSQSSAPISLGFLNPAILIPETLFNTLSDEELEHVVLHELGHLQRRDDWTNLAQKLIEAMLPVQPAVYWIGRRMSIEREMACDDWVIAATGTAESYASSLARVAELSHWAHAGILAAGATGGRSQLFQRVHHMLDKTRNATPKLALVPLGAAIAASGILVCASVRAPQLITFAQTSTVEIHQQAQLQLAPLQVTPTPAPSASLEAPLAEKSATAPHVLLASAALPALPRPLAALVEESQQSETHTEMTTRNGWSSLSVKIDGAVEFTDDDHDVKSLSPNGRFRIEEGSWFSGRVYEVKADSAGHLTRTYSVGRSVKPLDAEGQAWLEHLMPQMIRDSGFGAPQRVARILRQGGPQAVFNEIGLIHSDGSKRTYIEQLFSQAALNTEQTKEAARLIRGISSDGDKAQVLIDEEGKFFAADLRQSFFDAAESISSDGDKRRVLSDVIKKDASSSDTLLYVAKSAKHISSDGDKAEVLIEMAGPYRGNGGLDVAYFEAIKSISSDGDHARVLLAVLEAHGNDHDTLARVLRSAGKISSDGDKARVLKEAVTHYSNDASVSSAFIEAANAISSDGDHQQVLVALVHQRGLDSATLGEVAKSAQRISSDGDKARVLEELAGTNIEPVSNDFFAAANSIGSDGDHGHVLLTLLNKPGTSSAMAIGAIQSATRISSDGDKERVLIEAAHRYSRDPKVSAELRKAVESVHSDGVYRSVMSEVAQADSKN